MHLMKASSQYMTGLKPVSYTHLDVYKRQTIQNQRLSVMGVDTDEEAMDIMKFQQAYNLNSKMMSVMNQIYDKLINQTGL